MSGIMSVFHHASWYSVVEKMGSDMCTETRRCGQQVHRSNIPADNPSDYYCCCISIPLLDHLLSEMQSRCIKHHQIALLELCTVPSILVELPDEEYNTTAMKFADSYTDDLPSAD